MSRRGTIGIRDKGILMGQRDPIYGTKGSYLWDKGLFKVMYPKIFLNLQKNNFPERYF